MKSVPDRKIDDLVRSVAATFSAPGDFEDRVRIGRLAVIDPIRKRGITDVNLAKHSDYLWTLCARALTRERVNPLVERPGVQRHIVPAAESYASALDAACVRRYGRSFDLLRRRFGDRGLLERLQKDSLAHPRTTDRRIMVIWAVVAIRNIPIDAIPKRLKHSLFVDLGLTSWLWVMFNSSPYRAINAAYPGKFRPRDMAHAPMRYWSGRGGRRRAIEALREALASTGHPEAFYPKIATERFFEEFTLTSPLQKRFGSHFAFLDAAFPKRFHPWEMSVTPRGFFDKKANVIAATRWLVEERLGISMTAMSARDVWCGRYADAVTKEVFVANGLSEVMATYKSPEPVMRIAFEGKFYPWSFQRKGKWKGIAGRRLAAEATRWLLDEYLEISPLDEGITCETFRQNGLWGMLTSQSLGFHTSPTAALRNAYPEFADQLSRPAARRRGRNLIPTGRHSSQVGLLA